MQAIFRQHKRKGQMEGWRLVICDIDGTLLDDMGHISPENEKAIAELANQGIGFTLATGRTDQMTRTFVSQLAVRLPVIACNGAIIRDCLTDEILYRQDIPPADALAMMTWFQKNHFDFLCYTPDEVYFPAYSCRIETFHQYNRKAAEANLPEVPLFPIEGNEQNVAETGLLKILVMLPDSEAAAAIRKLLLEHPACTSVFSLSDGLDITAASVSKGSGLRKLGEILAIDPSNIAAFGDNDNDVSLFSAAGLGIAMGNATPDALAASHRVTARNSESGVAAGIYQYILPAAANAAREHSL